VYNFFGEDFVRAIGYKRFSSRRCNKSYLQGIDAISGMSKGKPKGYMLAALARSHKSGIGNLAKTTDIYLKDARFSGYTPEFIIKQMFERGVFSFIPAVLLEMYAGSEYTRLPVSIQTDLIGKIGLAAQNIERVTETVECALMKSKRTVNEMLNRTENIKENIFSILQNIASGNAPGRQKECLCLMTASGFRCAFSNRDSCIGCGYEIYTKTAMHMLMREYIRLSYVKDNAEPSEARRCGLILKKAVLPAVTEMIASIKILYPEADMDELLNIMEEGLNYANCNTGGNLQKLQ